MNNNIVVKQNLESGKCNNQFGIELPKLREDASRVEIRQETSLSDADLLRLSSIYQSAFSNPPWNENWTLAQAAEEILKYRENRADLIVATSQNQSIGLAIGMPLEIYEGRASLLRFSSNNAPYYLADLAVDCNWRGMGIGKCLVEGILQRSRESLMDGVIARTRTDNVSALAVFRAAGFLEVGVYEASTDGVSSERVVLEVRFRG